MGGPVTDETTGRYDWERIIRRCDLPSTTKLVAMMAATYANLDGTRVFPGTARLAAVCNLSERAVRAALGNLRDVGLIVRDVKGGMRGTKAYADVYHLAIPADLLDRIDMLGPDEERNPNRHVVPPGAVPNRHKKPSQPARGSSQPASDDIPTGTTCRPPTHDHSIDQPTNQTSGLVENVSTDRARDGAKIIHMVGRARR
jgi:Helix-turn-helix domain